MSDLTQPSRRLHLNAFLMGVGHHEAAWRHSRSDPAATRSVRHFQELGRIAERGKLDSVFFADNLSTGHNPAHNVQSTFEPITLLTAIASVTERVGLIATGSTSFHAPYNLARLFASLDHISAGRAGWNIVTSGTDAEAANFGLDTNRSHAERYERAAEFVDVALKLWDSWEDEALLDDAASGNFADSGRIHPINHEGKHFRVRGPLNSPRTPQGYPLLVQAGSSEAGKDLAARYAEAVFTAHQTLRSAQDFYRDLKSRLRRYHRDPDELLVLPGIVPIVGSTEAEAKRLERELEELIVFDYALRQLSGIVGVNLLRHPLDAPLPPLPPLEQVNGNKSRFLLVQELAEREELTVRQIVGKLGGGRGHHVLAGTPVQIADHLQHWFEQGAADGFNIMPPLLPSALEDFVDHVVPELQRRSLFRTEYEGRTLREHYGLSRPVSQFRDSGSGFVPSVSTSF